MDNAAPGRDWSLVDAAITATDPEDIALQRAYGPWQQLDDRDAQALLAGAGFDRVWWVCGGYAIEAFTGVARGHHDIDIGFFRCDLPRLRETVGDAYDLWSVGSRMLRLIDDHEPDLHEHSAQVWIRRHAYAPWLLDMLATVDLDGHWVHPRDSSQAVPLDEVTWVDASGIRHLDPDIVLAIKARARRATDEADFQACRNLLDERRRARLTAFLKAHHPDHPWLAELAGETPPHSGSGRPATGAPRSAQ